MKKKATTIITADALIKVLKKIPPETKVMIMADNKELDKFKLLPIHLTSYGNLRGEDESYFVIGFKMEHLEGDV